MGAKDTPVQRQGEEVGGGLNILQYSKKHWMKELGDGCWHASPKTVEAQGLVGFSGKVVKFSV